jgi:eukaryotic-like serine/threonine-protein kinase
MQLRPGTRLGPYEILQPLGAGGMGEVHRARHVKLGRDVAIKVLPDALSTDPVRLARFEREARTASALNHPSIITIHDIAEQDGVTFIAMELIEGRTLRELLAEGPLSIDEALRWATQIADALAKAHEAGVVHRDVKPANVMVTADGLAKVLDFGIARAAGAPADASEHLESPAGETQAGELLGTPHYMAPEQVAGEAVDHRADQFAFGALLYEMLVGEPPFEGLSLRALLSAILAREPQPLRERRPEVPHDLERVVARCLAKDREERFATTGELVEALHACAERRTRARYGLRATLRRPAVAGTLGVLLLAALGASGFWVRGAERRWAERDAFHEITRLTEQGEVFEAYRVALVAEKHRRGDPELQKLIERITLPVEVNTEPPGAEVWVKGYATPDARWDRVGMTPLQMRIPYALMRWRFTKPGFETFEGAPLSTISLAALRQGIPLDPEGARPAGTVRIPAGRVRPLTLRGTEIPAVELDSYFLDRYETTNAEFRAFVDAGGYRRPEWWPAPIRRYGRVLGWEEAVAAFRDASGEPGPATWEQGGYPPGEDDHPVSGISWFEAAAYCAYAGKSLPTVYHWLGAIDQDQFSDILQQSNLGGSAKAAVGRFSGLAAYGTYDMAGNVKEWIWNSLPGEQQHYILGGAWNDPAYMFRHLVAHDSWGREPTHGVRCAVYPQPLPEQLLAPLSPSREYEWPAPISDDAFALLHGFYAYDPAPLEARVERVDSLPEYRREVVSVRTAYGNERMDVIFLIPHQARRPYQSVIWFPGDDVFLLRSSESFSSAYLFDFIPRGGRVLVHPVYKGMFERFEPWERTPSDNRDMIIRWAQDLSRTIDYLEERPEFDARKIAYYGLSGGAVHGPVFTAAEARFAASILLGGGLVPIPTRPEVHAVLFAPRSRTPTLMINGEDDFIFPHESAQLPLFELLGAPPEKKRLARLPGGHIPTNRQEVVREVLGWLDLHLGPVEQKP